MPLIDFPEPSLTGCHSIHSLQTSVVLNNVSDKFNCRTVAAPSRTKSTVCQSSEMNDCATSASKTRDVVD